MVTMMTHLKNIAKLLCYLPLLQCQSVFWYSPVACLLVISCDTLYIVLF